MIVVETMFFDSDDYKVKTEVIPCDSQETAKAVVEKVYQKVLDCYNFKDDAKRQEWEYKRVKRKKNGNIFIYGDDCGYAEINIIDKEEVTADTLDAIEVNVSTVY